jgi:hypothetical protein
MSEYQYYEFVALDRPLDNRQQAEVRELSTRATVTPTSFINEYHWGNFRGDPDQMMEHYYDAHLYLANWGTRRIMFRLPCELLDLDTAGDYCVGDQSEAWTNGDHLVLDLTSEDESGEGEFDAKWALSAVIGVRAELALGDLRPLYLAWLAGYGSWERDEDAFHRDADHELEPPVPAGLDTLSAAQRALADFLRLDAALLRVAAQASPPLNTVAHDPAQLAAWVADLSDTDKDRWLLRVIDDHAAPVRMEMLRRLSEENITTAADPPRRTVGDLLDGAARLRA